MKNNSLLVVVSTHNGDFNLAENLIRWIGELDGATAGPAGCKLPYPCLLIVDQTVEQARWMALFNAAKKIFAHARVVTVQVPNTGWKPNTMFLTAAKYVHENYALPFLWLEPDCVPLKAGWLDDINKGYKESPLRYFGAVIEQTEQKNLPGRHLTGCSVYPNDAWEDFEKMAEVTSGRQAWDIAGAERIATAATNTGLIHHFWGQKDKPPVFVESREPNAPENHVLLNFIKPDAVLFHRNKTGDLIPLLRKAHGISPSPNNGEAKAQAVTTIVESNTPPMTAPQPVISDEKPKGPKAVSKQGPRIVVPAHMLDAAPTIAGP